MRYAVKNELHRAGKDAPVPSAGATGQAKTKGGNPLLVIRKDKGERGNRR
jgi:hypothetical protein